MNLRLMMQKLHVSSVYKVVPKPQCRSTPQVGWLRMEALLSQPDPVMYSLTNRTLI